MGVKVAAVVMGLLLGLTAYFLAGLTLVWVASLFSLVAFSVGLAAKIALALFAVAWALRLLR